MTNNLSGLFAKRRLAAAAANSTTTDNDSIKKQAEFQANDKEEGLQGRENDSNEEIRDDKKCLSSVATAAAPSAFSFQFDVPTVSEPVKPHTNNKRGKKKRKGKKKNIAKGDNDDSADQKNIAVSDSVVEDDCGGAVKLSPPSTYTSCSSSAIIEIPLDETVPDDGKKSLPLQNGQSSIQLTQEKIARGEVVEEIIVEKTKPSEAESQVLTVEETRARAAKILKQRTATKSKNSTKSTSSKQNKKKVPKKQAVPALAFDAKKKKLNFGMVNRTSMSNRQHRPIHPPGFEKVSEGERMQNVFSFGFDFQSSEVFQR